jgi:type VI protein secretion system component Hcp
MHKPFIVTSQRLEAASVSWAAPALDSANRLSSDPEEGGEVTAARTKPRPTVSEINVTHRTDSSSPTLLASGDGDSGTPPPSGSATITVARNTCASGQHIKEATISVRGRTFVLHDVDVAGCTANGDGTDTCTLNYASIGS